GHVHPHADGLSLSVSVGTHDQLLRLTAGPEVARHQVVTPGLEVPPRGVAGDARDHGPPGGVVLYPPPVRVLTLPGVIGEARGPGELDPERPLTHPDDPRILPSPLRHPADSGV